MAGSPATVPASVDGKYGITNTLTGYTIESENISDSPVRETVPDQFNRVAKEIRYDTRYELRLTVRGATKPSADAQFNYPDANTHWIVDTVEYAGSYNGLQRYNITAHRFSLCDQETALVTTAAQTPAS